MLRAIALSLALLVGIGAIVPLATQYTEAGPKKHAKSKKREWKGVKKYSKRWWQLYRRQERRKKARAKARRTLRLRQIRLANAGKPGGKGSENQNYTAKSSRKSAVADSASAVLPTGENAPKGWKRGQPSNSELQYRVDSDNGSQVGSASIAIVGPALGGENDSPRSKTVGGVSMSSLRRTVIDKMVREEGWVVNDYQKEIGGKNVYVVVAQSPGAGNRVQSRLFYFTEVGGQIYSVATNAPSDDSKRIEQESERVINSLQRRGTMQQAELK
ncbi:MAG: hypothetical protein ACR2MG_17330 [Pyrinomonadaceae bacterium]